MVPVIQDCNALVSILSHGSKLPQWIGTKHNYPSDIVISATFGLLPPVLNHHWNFFQTR